MLKRRIIPKFLLRNGRLVKYRQFDRDERRAGNPVSTAKVYNDYGVDEIIIVDIDRTDESRRTMLATLEDISRDIFIPVTAGGGIRSREDVRDLLNAGADKVSINSAAIADPSIVADLSAAFGAQCIVASIDYREVRPHQFRVCTEAGRKQTILDPVECAQSLEAAGCGEIMLTSIDRDGMMTGFDLDMLRRAVERLRVPVIASGGGGNLLHCAEAMEAGVSALAIGSMFFFTDQSPVKVRSYLVSNNLPVRRFKRGEF